LPVVIDFRSEIFFFSPFLSVELNLSIVRRQPIE
jgi:hypothetical protein